MEEPLKSVYLAEFSNSSVVDEDVKFGDNAINEKFEDNDDDEDYVPNVASDEQTNDDFSDDEIPCNNVTDVERSNSENNQNEVNLPKER